MVIDRGDRQEEAPEPSGRRSGCRRRPIQRLRISGLVKFGTGLRWAGRRWPASTFRRRRGLFEKGGAVRRDRGRATSTACADAGRTGQIRSILPANARARTGQQQAQKDAKDTNSFISFLRGFLLAFGGIALFVGSFVIANSLSITIAQRTREFATLRTLGASRRQEAATSIVIESLVVGECWPPWPGSSSASAWRRGSSGSSTRSASRCRTAA